MSVAFSWQAAEVFELLASCDRDDVLPVIRRHIPRTGRVLESGCGAGRFVKYFYDQGWDITGLEISVDTVDMVRGVWPELNVIQGDAANSPFADDEFDGIISLGVIEHFPPGPGRVLQEMRRTLKPGGVAVITVPCMNTVRRAKRLLFWKEIQGAPMAFARRIIKHRPQPLNRLCKGFKYAVEPAWGGFFEYRLTPNELREVIEQAGFELIEHLPLYQIDGIYHELNPFGRVVNYRRHIFELSLVARLLIRILSRRPFLCCHMQAAVVRKP